MTAHGAKVILKDGKILEGKIIAETEGDVLIKTAPLNRPKLIYSDEILSVVRDPVVKPPRDPQRYASLELLPSVHVFSSENISLDPAAGIWVGGGLRWHPLLELGAGFDWKPGFSGALAVSDGTTTRRYESFASYGGGFAAKVYPFYRWKWRIEPYLVGGYEWSRLVPQASGDGLKGQGFKVGAGTAWPINEHWYLTGQLVYRQLVYDRIFFLQRDGGLDPSIRTEVYSTSIGISYRF